MAKRKRTWTKKQKAAYWARRRLQNKFRYDPSYKNMRMDIFGPNRRQYRETGKAASRDQLDMRRAIGYYGEGDYKDWLKWGSRIGGAALGGLRGFSAGGIPGALTGLAPGYEEGKQFSKMMGWGDYNTPSVANQIVARAPGNAAAPVFVNPSEDLSGDVMLYHREFIGNITVKSPDQVNGGGSSNFEVRSFEVNPGVKETFPFLSQIAQNFELYQFEGLMFQYVPTYGESSSSANNLGKIVMATNYDPDAASFSNSVQMQNYDYSNSCKPSLGQVHGVETASSKRATDMLYVRSGTTSRDKVFTDIGRFEVGTEGIPLAANTKTAIIGELWVTYKVKLSRAHLNDYYDDTRHHGASYNTSGVIDVTFKASETITPVDSATNFIEYEITHMDVEKEYYVSFVGLTENSNPASAPTATLTNASFSQRVWGTSLGDSHGAGKQNFEYTYSRCFVMKPSGGTVRVKFTTSSGDVFDGDTTLNIIISNIHPL